VLEASCPRCGAVFTPAGDVQNCPHCGLDCGTATAQFRLNSPRYIRRALFFGLSAAVYLPIFVGMKWIYWAIAASLLVLGLLWAFISRKTRLEYHDPTAPLNVYASRADAKSEQSSLPLRHPETPRKWKALISAPRPREVYLPFGSKVGLLFAILVWIVGCGPLWFSVITHRALFGRVVHWHRSDWFALLSMAFWMIWTLTLIRQEVPARTLLREAEVPIGYWNDGSYRFWTKSGESFQRAATIGSLEGETTDTGLVPVFYLPQDPTKSVALCSLLSRIRVPSESGSRELAQASAQS
jgi:hypothetical protein